VLEEWASWADAHREDDDNPLDPVAEWAAARRL
jgi:hypothetical protein